MSFKQVDICYRYDGSFYGMLCCVFESFENKEIPAQITCYDFSFFQYKDIVTDENKAKRILKAVSEKINDQALRYVKYSYLASFDEKEIALIHFIRQGFKYGSTFVEYINPPSVCPTRVIPGALANTLPNNYIAKLKKGVDLLSREGGKFIEFARFSEFNGLLVSVIEPEHNVLPLLATHFSERYVNDQFMIYDKTHQLALIYTDYKSTIVPVEEYEMPQLDEEETKYRRLWRLFYNTIEIKERHNERCRMNLMPKKYWKNMTEFMTD